MLETERAHRNPAFVNEHLLNRISMETERFHETVDRRGQYEIDGRSTLSRDQEPCDTKKSLNGHTPDLITVDGAISQPPGQTK